MLDRAVALLQEQLTTNQFFSGGAVLMVIGALGVYLRSLPRTLWNWGMRVFTIYVEVTSTDETYNWICLWLHTRPYIARARRVSLKYVKHKAVIVPSKGNHVFLWRGRPVWLNWSDEEGKVGGGGFDLSQLTTREKLTIRILGRDRSVIKTLLSEAEALLKEEAHDKVEVYIRRGSWSTEWRLERREPRGLDTVFLPAQAMDLKADMERFLQQREWYYKHGIPYRRGYLFYGPPGNGKSSAVYAMASELRIPLYVLNLGAISNDAALEQAVHTIDVGKPGILLIEDIDTAIPDREQDKQKKSFSLGTLLNVMDGVVARENLLLIVTTNHIGNMDPAMLRPGRIDRMIEFGNAGTPQIHAAIRLFLPDADPDAVQRALFPEDQPVSMARVQEALLQQSESLTKT